MYAFEDIILNETSGMYLLFDCCLCEIVGTRDYYYTLPDAQLTVSKH